MTVDVPRYETILIRREGRRLTLTLNRPDCLNAIDLMLHDELPEALAFAAHDVNSDIIVLTGAGRAFSAGGDIAHLERNADSPHLFDHEARMAKRIVTSLIDIEKPVICRLNGHAVGLGASIALLCDIVIAAETAKIGDPHVAIGLVAGDGGALIWAQRVGLGRAKEYLLTGALITADKAADIGLINHCVPVGELDAKVDEVCDKILANAPNAVRWTKVLMNMELKRSAVAVIEAGIAYEAVSVRSADHREGVAALKAKRLPTFTGK